MCGMLHTSAPALIIFARFIRRLIGFQATKLTAPSRCIRGHLAEEME